MVALLPLLAVGGVAYLLKGKKKLGKLVDVSKGPVGGVVKGAGLGAFVNWADGKFLGGRLQSLKIGSAQKGKNLNAADAVTILIVEGTHGFSTKGLKDTAAVLAGKKIGEYTGAIDPYEATMQNGMPKITYYAKTGGLNS